MPDLYPRNLHPAYHAHVYFDADTLAFASSLCEQAGKVLNVQVGRVHERLVGPHPCWSCQLSFVAADFDKVVGWLDEHRNGLSVLVHGLTGDNLKDHTDYAYWLGDAVPLNLEMFR